MLIEAEERNIPENPKWPMIEVIPATIEEMEMIERMWLMPCKEQRV